MNTTESQSRKNKSFFISDLHLGTPSLEQSLEREKKVLRWLQSVENEAKAIYLLGDIFDYWFEYRYVVPKGYVRLLGYLALMADRGIDIHFFNGNHDLWTKDYFDRELGFHTHTEPLITTIDNKTFYLAHGDGLDKADKKYIFIKHVFASRFNRFLYSLLHPYLATMIGKNLSKTSRKQHITSDYIDKGEQEAIFLFCKEHSKNHNVDFYVMGHRHIATDREVSETTRYINTGQWITESHYACWDGENMTLCRYEDK
ncbi:MAG: UDP-2,3-diacylglucosamine diphosphatase [Bacteroidales bacterium]|jgi:UDP-2,3-diacylglucosamine hydrolase|nr:UDP-2,3-diacylglucosamine diphosphatase [Bacteroidales bacterium]